MDLMKAAVWSSVNALVRHRHKTTCRDLFSSSLAFYFSSCASDDFLCSDGTACVQRMEVCDGRAHCSDGSDEKLCPAADLTAARKTARKIVFYLIDSVQLVQNHFLHLLLRVKAELITI